MTLNSFGQVGCSCPPPTSPRPSLDPKNPGTASNPSLTSPASGPQTHPCSQRASRREKMHSPPLAALVSCESLPSPTPSGPESRSQALGDFLTLAPPPGGGHSQWPVRRCVDLGQEKSHVPSALKKFGKGSLSWAGSSEPPAVAGGGGGLPSLGQGEGVSLAQVKPGRAGREQG